MQSGSRLKPDLRQRSVTRVSVNGFSRLTSIGAPSAALNCVSAPCPLRLDAAHIRWHQAGGPDEETNGLALCVLHHKTFDLGAFTVSKGIVLISDRVTGTGGFHETLMAYHTRPVREPQRPEWGPEPKHLDWHGREVFKGQPRHRD